jgi:hypothetical protein
MRTSTAAIAVAEDVRIRLLWDLFDLLRELDAIGDDLDVIELRFGRGAALQAERQRQHGMRALVCEQVRILLGGAESTATVH